MDLIRHRLRTHIAGHLARAYSPDERTDPAREPRQGPACEPQRCAWRKRKTGDGCSLSPHRQAQITGEFVRIELLLAQIKEEADEARDIMLAAAETITSSPSVGLNLKGIGPEFAAVLSVRGAPPRFVDRRPAEPKT